MSRVALDRFRLGEWVRLGASATAGGLGAAACVAGVEVAGLSVGMFLQAVGWLELGLPFGGGELLGGGLVLLALGWFMVGLAWESLLPRAPRWGKWSRDEVAVAWLGGTLLGGAAVGTAGWAFGTYAGALWPSLYLAGLLLWAVGWAGVVAGPVVTGAFWGLGRVRSGWERARLPALLLVWGAISVPVFFWGGGLQL